MVLLGGPWMIYGPYLVVQPWSREFMTKETHALKIVAWIRLPGLSYRYYTKQLMRAIASVIGEAVKVDYNNTIGQRGWFARVVVIIDVKKPFIPCVRIDGILQRIEYEGLPTICYKCGHFGHTQDSCEVCHMFFKSPVFLVILWKFGIL